MGLGYTIISAMQTLRHFTFLTRLVLAWFVLSLGVAVASPLVNPQATLLVCTGAGAMKVLVTADDGSTREVTQTTMDCPLCVPTAPPPAFVSPSVEPIQALSYALRGITSAHIAARTAAPLPARGPPSPL
jgi:hypothetical protein